MINPIKFITEASDAEELIFGTMGFFFFIALCLGGTAGVAALTYALVRILLRTILGSL
jgi:hypothetical protein